MTAPNDGGPAFPLFLPPSETGEHILPIQYGMTLRDYFAAHAPFGAADVPTHKTVGEGDRQALTQMELCAVISRIRYDYADAMLAQRSK